MSKSEPMPEELAQIHGEAVAMEAADAVQQQTAAENVGPQPEQAAVTDYMTDARGVTDIIATSLGAIWPSTAVVLTDETRGKFAGALAPVMEKYGLSLGAVFGRWGAEINLCFVVAGFAVPLAGAISADRKAARAEKQREEAQRTVVAAADPENLANRV